MSAQVITRQDQVCYIGVSIGVAHLDTKPLLHGFVRTPIRMIVPLVAVGCLIEFHQCLAYHLLHLLLRPVFYGCDIIQRMDYLPP